MRSFDKYITEEDLAHRRQLADELRADPEKFRRYQEEARRKLAARDKEMAALSHETPVEEPTWRKYAPIGAAVVLAIAGIALLSGGKKK